MFGALAADPARAANERFVLLYSLAWMGVMAVWNLNFSTIKGISATDEKVPWSVLNADFSDRPAFTALKSIVK